MKKRRTFIRHVFEYVAELGAVETARRIFSSDQSTVYFTKSPAGHTEV